ncbi:MAG TPA: hypothetical protein VD905_16750 [Flavobacteriales bacterium]|nr:hypothetical protein [Flavobacteriales bacterium]
MAPPVKIPLSENDKKNVNRRITANYFAIVIVPGISIAAIPAMSPVYSVSQTVMPWIVGCALTLLAFCMFLIFLRMLRRLHRLKTDGHKFREHVSLKEAQALESHSHDSKGVKKTSYWLEMPDKHKFILTYRQFVLVKKLEEFHIEYKPYNYNRIDTIQTLDFNREIEALQNNSTIRDLDFADKVQEALRRITSRTDKEPDEPGEPSDN